MTEAQASAVHHLLEHVDKLKALHRANESPSFGQVELLFDLAAVAKFALVSPSAPTRSAAWPTQGVAIEKVARRLVELVSASLSRPEPRA